MSEARKVLLADRDDLFVVHDFLSPEECDYYVTMSEAVGFGDAPITTMSGPVMRKDIRNNDRVMIDDPHIAAAMWERLKPFFPERVQFWLPVGLNERWRFYRYDPGQQFDWHQDAPFERDDGERSFWTFMIYLNDGFEGGETSFDDSCSPEPFDDFQVVPQAGTALFFVHEIHHKGEPVLDGRKYVLRTDVMYAPKGRRSKRRKEW